MIQPKKKVLKKIKKKIYKIHPFYHLHRVRTFRSSSANPNWQNQPIRDPEQARIIRGGIMASPGNHLVEIDYGALEFKIITALSQDPKAIEYASDDNSDVHGDVAQWIIKLKKSEVDPAVFAKIFRFHTKNKFIFANFYGSWYLPCANNLWDEIIDAVINEDKSDLTLKQHLKNKRQPGWEKKLIEHLNWINSREENPIKIVRLTQEQKDNYTREEFQVHIKEVTEQFWDTFSGIRDWQESAIEDYKKSGYMQTPLGFRYNTVMSRNDIYNYRVQGTAFHCLLWSLTKLNKSFKFKGMVTRIMGQIHDSIILDIPPEELVQVLEMAEQVMTIDLRERFPWINIPMVVEFEITPPSGTWLTKCEMTIPEVKELKKRKLEVNKQNVTELRQEAA